MLNIKKKFNKHIYTFLLLGFVCLLFFILKFAQPTTKEIFENKFNMTINGNVVNSKTKNIIYVENFNPEILIENRTGLKLSIDKSLNVLGDKFYGNFILDKDIYKYIPNFSITPGPHEFILEDSEGNKEVFDIVIAYHETFSKTLESNNAWIIPTASTPSWFSIVNNKLKIVPDTEDGNSSYAFVYNLNNNFVIDFEITPIGENFDVVPYVINSVKNEIVLGSNDPNRNVLFYSDSKEKKLIEGEKFFWEKDSRYHVRLKHSSEGIKLLAKRVINEEEINPENPDDSFTLILDVSRDISKNNEHPHRFGISLWKNSNGVTVDDIFITNL